MALSKRQQEALDWFFRDTPEARTGNLRDDAITAAKQTWRLRNLNGRYGGIVLDMLREGVEGELPPASLRVIQYLTAGTLGPDDPGIPPNTIKRWSERPGSINTRDEPPDPAPEGPTT